MPTYVYRCPACDHVFEVFHPRMNDLPKTKKCSACGGRARREISGGAGFLFKGEGFYITDYRSAEYKKKAAADKGEGKPEKAGTEKSGEKSSGDKPAADKASSDKPTPKKSTRPKPGGRSGSSD